MSVLQFYAAETFETREVGPAHAAQKTFSGSSVDSFVKELAQNSFDAWHEDGDEKLDIRISKRKIKCKDIPDYEIGFKRIIQCQINHYRGNTQYKSYAEKLERIMDEHEIEVLVYEDFNTRGLEGGDEVKMDDKYKSFSRCVNDDNYSEKSSADSRGGHGIGKNAVFNLSKLQTVIYYSKNIHNEYKFKGVSKLGSYTDQEGTRRSNTVFYGKKEGQKVSLVDTVNDIPRCFKRTRDTPGTSQFILGVSLPSNKKNPWQDQVKRAFLENYWWALAKGNLEITIDNSKLHKENFFKTAEKLYGPKTTKKIRKNSPIPYIRAYSEGTPHSTTIPNLGVLKLHLLEAADGEQFPNHISFLRSGMLIEPISIKAPFKPMAGVMYCESTQGNIHLKNMEPPSHNKFEPERLLEVGSTLSVKEGEEILNEISKFRLAILKEYKEQYQTNSQNIDFVDDLFSNLLSGGTGTGAGSSQASKTESHKYKILPKSTKIMFSSLKQNDVSNTNDSQGENIGQSPELPREPKNGPDRERNPKKHIKGVKSRIFLMGYDQDNPRVKKYKLVLRSYESVSNLKVEIKQHGEFGSTPMSCKLMAIENNPGDWHWEPTVTNSNDDVNKYVLSNISLNPNEPTVLDLVFEDERTSAFNVKVFL